MSAKIIKLLITVLSDKKLGKKIIILVLAHHRSLGQETREKDNYTGIEHSLRFYLSAMPAGDRHIQPRLR